MNKKSGAFWVPMGLILLIALGTGILDYFTPLMGDDMAKWMDMGGDDPSTFPGRKVISFIGGAYFDCNGRVFDAFGPVIYSLLPRLLGSVLIGGMCGLFFYALALCGGVFQRGKIAFACGFLTLSLLVLPWWDSMFMRVCHYNYVWAAAFALLFIHAWFREHKPGRWGLIWLFILGGLAGCFHEQIGVAMTAYFGLTLLIGRCRDWHWTPFLGLLLGTLVTIATPAIWSRNSEFIEDSSRLEMLWTTLPLVVLLCIVTVAILLSGSRLKAVVRSPRYQAYLFVALFSSVIALYSSIPGRTGWLAECCALLGFAMLCAEARVKLSRPLAGGIIALSFAVVAVHFAVSIHWQRKMFGEYSRAIELYRQSPDGVVRMDYTDRLEVSPLTLYRVKGLPDADDTYLLRVFERHFGPGKPLTLIGPEAEIFDALPANYELIYNAVPDTIMLLRSSMQVVIPFTEGDSLRYRIEPIVVDPGDNWHPVK